MLDLDIEQFREDEEAAHEDNCFSKNTKQVALGIRIRQWSTCSPSFRNST